MVAALVLLGQCLTTAQGQSCATDPSLGDNPCASNLGVGEACVYEAFSIDSQTRKMVSFISNQQMSAEREVVGRERERAFVSYLI